MLSHAVLLCPDEQTRSQEFYVYTSYLSQISVLDRDIQQKYNIEVLVHDRNKSCRDMTQMSKLMLVLGPSYY